MSAGTSGAMIACNQRDTYGCVSNRRDSASDERSEGTSGVTLACKRHDTTVALQPVCLSKAKVGVRMKLSEGTWLLLQPK